MTDERAPRIEHLLDLTARKVSGGGLHPLEVVQKVREAAETSVRDGVVANDYIVALNPGDYRRFALSLRGLREGIDGALDDLERERGLRRVGDRRLEFGASDAAGEGTPVVTARFRDTSHPVRASLPNETRRITRLRGLALVLPDGTRVRLTHAPFAIGRGPGNDLVLPSLAVSRRHAEIEVAGDRVVMRDLGSRNGLVVDGARYDRVTLTPGTTVTIGDIALRLEAEG